MLLGIVEKKFKTLLILNLDRNLRTCTPLSKDNITLPWKPDQVSIVLR